MSRKGVKELPWKEAGLECHKCKVLTEPVTVSYGGYEIRGWRCPKCGEEMLHPEDAQFVLELKKTGKIEATVSRIGRQTVIRVPALIRDYYRLDKSRSIILKPKDKQELTIEITSSKDDF